MKFESALKLAVKGKKIRRRCWGNTAFYVTTNFINLEEDDYTGKDWELFALNVKGVSE